MRNIPIIILPNQSFTTTINEVRYDVQLRDNDGFMTYDISINEGEPYTGNRFVIGQLMLPYKYMEVDGNFILDTPVEQEPDYTQFGGTQNLYWLTAEEAEVFRSVA